MENRSGSKGRFVKIATARFVDGKPTDQPFTEGSEGRPPTYHRVWVGNDEEGWTEVPWVTDVDVPLRQGQPQKAIVTVAFPQVEITGER